MSTTTTTIEAAPATTYPLAERGAKNIALGADIPYPIPTFDDPLEKRKWVLEHMAAAFRVFGRMGFTEGTAGHISVRDPVNPRTFWINPLGKHFSLMKASDMVQVDEEGNVIGGNKVAVNAAGFKIHSQLHKARPDVNAACHTHSVYGKAYSAFGKPLEMLNQDVCTFYKAHSVYQDFGGVVLEEEEGKKIAQAIGDGKGVILQNHGLLTVGETVDEAAYLFMLMEKSCRVQLLVDQIPNLKPTLISDEAAAYTYHMSADPETLYQEFQPEYEIELGISDDFLFPKKE